MRSEFKSRTPQLFTLRAEFLATRLLDKKKQLIYLEELKTYFIHRLYRLFNKLRNI